MVDRRRDLRAMVRLEVEPGNLSLKRPPFYVTGNISTSGMFLITSDPLPEKTRLKLQFEVPGEAKKIEVIGEVIWCREQGERPALVPGMGIKFLRIREQDRASIDRFVRELLEEEKRAGEKVKSRPSSEDG